MKKIVLIFIVFSLSLYSCEKSLDTVPSDFISPEYYFNNETELNFALIGVYDIVGKGELLDNLLIVLNSVDEFNVTNSTTTESFVFNSGTSIFYGIWQKLYDGIERANLLLANIDKPAMDEAKRTIVKGEVKFLRAYFYFTLVQNFGAVPLKLTPTASVEDVYYPSIPVSEVYDFIYNEMVEAETMVQPITAFTGAGKVSKSAVQAMLARVCLYMAGFPNNNTEKYKDAVIWAEKVIQSGYHELHPDFSQVFINLIQNKYYNKECIWEMEEYSGGATSPYSEGGSLGTNNGISQQNTLYRFAGGAYRIYETLYKKFDPTDLRRDWTIAPYKFNGNNTNVKVNWLPTESLYIRNIGKWRREYELVADPIKGLTGTNMPVIRYSDVLLIAAEADNELNGPTTKSIDYVNQVRRRGYGNGKVLKSITVTAGGSGYSSANPPVITISGGGGVNTAGLDPASATATITGTTITAITIVGRGTFYNSVPTVTITGGNGVGATATAALAPVTDADLLPAQTASKEDFRTAIRDERIRELSYEGRRRNDLIRWGTLVSTMKDLSAYVSTTAPTGYRGYLSAPGNNVSERNNYFPIPIRELSLNPLLTQNPGW